jgi:putative membrane protein
LRATVPGVQPGEPTKLTDYRFSLANERTFLAWIRTALALIGAGLAIGQFLPKLGVFAREAVAIVFVALGATAAIRAVRRRKRYEEAIRDGVALPQSRFPAVLGGLLAAGGLVLLVALVIEQSR